MQWYSGETIGFPPTNDDPVRVGTTRKDDSKQKTVGVILIRLPSEPKTTVMPEHTHAHGKYSQIP